MQLIPIKQFLEENEEFALNPLCTETLQMCTDFYKKIGFEPPWICYYAEVNGGLVGSAGFKGAPKNNKIEIAYGTFEKYRKQGIGTEICKQLITLALKTKADVIVTAQTLPINNYSTQILKKNNFVFTGTLNDPEDGEVWEWKYKG